MIRINLIAEGRKPVAPTSQAGRGFSLGSENAAVVAMIGIVVVVVLGYAGYWLLLRRDIENRKIEIAEAQATVDELQEAITEVERFNAKKAELQHRIEVIGDLRDNQRGPVRIMDQVSQGLPELLWLDRLSLTSQAVTIQGRSFTTNAVATFIENLDRVEEFQEPILKVTTWNGRVYSFQIVFNYKSVPIRSARAADTVPAG